MKAGGGAPKGSAFERSVCKDLSLWITYGERDDIFWRTAMSGGRATIGLRAGNVRGAQAGDIGAIDPIGLGLLRHFVVEAKFRKNIQLHKFITNNEGLLAVWWKKHTDECMQHGRLPFMVVKQNRMRALLLLSWRGIFKFEIHRKNHHILLAEACLDPINRDLLKNMVYIINYAGFLDSVAPIKNSRPVWGGRK